MNPFPFGRNYRNFKINLYSNGYFFLRWFSTKLWWLWEKPLINRQKCESPAYRAGLNKSILYLQNNIYMNSHLTLFSSSSSLSCSVPLGWCLTWLPTTNRANISSCTGSTISRTTHKMSKRDRIGSVKSTFSANVSDASYLPPIGFEAAIILHLA